MIDAFQLLDASWEHPPKVFAVEGFCRTYTHQFHKIAEMSINGGNFGAGGEVRPGGMKQVGLPEPS